MRLSLAVWAAAAAGTARAPKLAPVETGNVPLKLGHMERPADPEAKSICSR